MGADHGDYTYLNNACYLSGSFPLDCPKDEAVTNPAKKTTHNSNYMGASSQNQPKG